MLKMTQTTVLSDDGICKIASLVFCFLLYSPVSGIFNYINQITSERQRCPDVAFISRNRVPCYTHKIFAHCKRPYCDCEMKNINESSVPLL